MRFHNSHDFLDIRDGLAHVALMITLWSYYRPADSSRQPPREGRLVFPGHAACKGAIVKTSDVVKRYTSLAVSLFFNALGIALITQAHLGTTPITTLPYTLAAIFGLTLGTTTFACNLLFLLLQRILLRRRLGIAELLQIPPCSMFSVFILRMHLTARWFTDVYICRSSCASGSCRAGAGISLELMTNATVIPAKAWSRHRACSRRTSGNIKCCSNCSLVLASSSSALPCWQHRGLREGTRALAVRWHGPAFLALDAQTEAPALSPTAPAPAPHLGEMPPRKSTPFPSKSFAAAPPFHPFLALPTASPAQSPTVLLDDYCKTGRGSSPPG